VFIKKTLSKLQGLNYRLDLIDECNRLKKSGKLLPKDYKKLIFRLPSRYDDFIQFLCFVNNNNTINLIDIGTNAGEFSKNFLLFFPKCNSINCFEPLSYLNNTIKENLKIKPDLKYQIINKALSNKTGKQKIYYDKNNTELASLNEYSVNYRKSFPDLINNEYKASSEEIVEIDLLDNFCKDFSLNHEFIVKIDSQGNELEVIQGGVETLRRSSVVLLECSFAPQYIDKEHTFSECVAILKNLDLHPIIFQKYGKIISSYGVERDVIFVKKELLSKVYYKNY